MCKLAIQNYNKHCVSLDECNILEFIPEKYKTLELYKLAVENGGSALEYVPEQYITLELCRYAIQNNIWSLKYVP